MKSVLSLVPAIFLASVSMAFSADAVSQIPDAPAAQDAAAFSWDGIYLGGLAGYGWLNLKDDSGSGFGEEKFNGARLGGFLGYNVALQNNIVLGVEGDLNYDFNNKDFSSVSTSIETGLNGSVRARAGYAMDRVLFYGAAGWTATNLQAESFGFKFSDTASGWTVGAGADYAFTNTIFGRAEYRYNDYGKADLAGTALKLDQHVINVGVGVKF